MTDETNPLFNAVVKAIAEYVGATQQGLAINVLRAFFDAAERSPEVKHWRHFAIRHASGGLLIGKTDDVIEDIVSVDLRALRAQALGEEG